MTITLLINDAKRHFLGGQKQQQHKGAFTGLDAVVLFTAMGTNGKWANS
jgi:hypothetical protein